MGLLGWALIFLVIAALAGLMGFTNVAAGAALFARVLFGILLVVILVVLLLVLLGRISIPQLW